MTNEREERAARNNAVIEEFRANNGLVGGRATVLLLHHTGARTGTERVNPLAFRQVDGGWAIFASRAGADRHPDWYHNLVANPQVGVELGGESFEADAVVTEGEERDRLFAAQVAAMPPFAEYEKKTSRRIPVVRLRRR